MYEVVINDLKFSYDNDKYVLGGVDYTARPGDFVCLLGQSGCGKSTLLRLIAGLEKSEPEQLTVNGEAVKGPSLDHAMIFQDYGLFPWMTAGENICIALRQRFPEWSKVQRKEAALKWMGNLSLGEELYDKLPMNLSGGQRQRFATARAFAMDSPLMLMDEPFGALDAVTKALLQDTVVDLWQKEKEKRKTIFFVTHSVDEALLLATDIVVLGQAPSKVIYTHHFTPENKPTRDILFTDPEIMELRNNLTKIINDDIAQRAKLLQDEREEQKNTKKKISIFRGSKK